MSIYDFTVKTNRGEEKSLADYKGKVMLIVNTASQCGFTTQYDGLQELHTKYADKGLAVLGFPCDQFGGQNPEDNEETAKFCRRNHGVTFELFDKGDVRGDTAHPLFKFLITKQGFKGLDKDHPNYERLSNALSTRFPEYLEGDDVKWNFTKFLVDRDGNIIARFEPTRTPASIADEIEKLL